MATNGFVSLVGAGPGDPDLLTLKALRRLQDADVVVFDRLVSDAIMDLVPQGVGRISVGKSPGNHCVPQQQINTVIANLALAGRRVVRLKGGDPCIFGRGGEEALVLREHGIPFEFVPGITAASGCSSYAGIPLTHRGLAHGVRFVTGHRRHDEELDLDWDKLADPDCTLVIYMGLANAEYICTRLIRAGLAPQTPAAAIQDGCQAGQRKLCASLADLAAGIDASGMSAPVTLIIGAVVALGEQLDWFDANSADSTAEDSVHEPLSLVSA
jgi:uroporphyrin-III C-methyltransferase/precorrin-2 dehydrogenase/sirohydrochlorin ferrochelatase/uroporphyrin-III C-methyltransferase